MLLLLFTANSGGSPGDVTAPTLQSATISGSTLRLRFDETVIVNDGTGIALTLSGGAVTATYASGSGGTTLLYSLSRTPATDETGTLDYTNPGDGIEDLAGNDLDSIVSAAISVAGGGILYQYSQFTTSDVIQDVAQEVIQ